MRTLRISAFVALAVSLAACGSDAGSNREESYTPPAHTINVTYDPPKSQADATAKEILDAGGLGGIADGFSEKFRLPIDLTIRARHGSGSPFYDPQTKRITLYYGFVTLTSNIIRAGEPGISDNELGTQWAAVNDFFLVHEMGHAFVDLFDIPITGREEDAVDGMATVFFVNNVEGGAEYAFDAAIFFHLLQDFQGAPNAAQFQDEHSLSAQRGYDVACSVAGSSETTMRQIATLGILPDARLARCPDEYRQKSDAWGKLLEPYMR